MTRQAFIVDILRGTPLRPDGLAAIVIRPLVCRSAVDMGRMEEANQEGAVYYKRKKRNVRYGLAMCVGVNQGVAVGHENVTIH